MALLPANSPAKMITCKLLPRGSTQNPSPGSKREGEQLPRPASGRLSMEPDPTQLQRVRGAWEATLRNRGTLREAQHGLLPSYDST